MKWEVICTKEDGKRFYRPGKVSPFDITDVEFWGNLVFKTEKACEEFVKKINEGML
jgi:hypothetical protein